jgi:hypothetical protein
VIAGLLAALLTAWLAGWLAVAAAWQAPAGAAAAGLTRASLALGLGLGLTSMAFVLAIDVGRASRTAAVLADLVLVTALGAVGWRRARPAPSVAVSAVDPGGGRIDRALGFAVVLLAGLAIAIAGLKAVAYPHGEWDAWAIWNLKARMMARGGDSWRTTIAQLVPTAHPDYPLLVPGAVARAWMYLGRETWLAPAAVGGAFTAGTVALAAGVLWLRRGPTSGLVAAVLLLGSPYLIDHGLLQNADIQVAFFLLAALGLLAVGDAQPAHRRSGLVLLAGLALGFMAWSKNEGILYLLCAGGAHLVVTGRRAGSRAAVRETALLAAGAAPALAMLAYHRATMPVGWLVHGQSAAGIAERLLDPARYAVIGATLLREGLGLGGWLVSVLGLLLACAPAWGVRAGPVDRASAGRTAITVVAALLGVLAVYVLTPLSLAWQVGTSLPRILTQLWPSLVLLFGLVVRPPSSSGEPAVPPPAARH